MLSEVDGDGEGFTSDKLSSIRVIELEKVYSGSCGFHLTRSKWDPYPWVTKVDDGTPADLAGMQPGDCLLEINGEDIVGKRISEIADRIKTGSNRTTILVWNTGSDTNCSPESLCCGPMPKNLQRLSACMSSILSVLECPVCLDTIPPPSHQCDNGHLICLKCRTKTDKCPVCRLRLMKGRSLLADQVYNAITDVFDLREETEKNRKEKMQKIFKLKGKNKNVPDIKVTYSHTNKFLARLVGKSTSADNLSNDCVKSTPATFKFSLEHDFGNHLKTKSYSTSEIFKASSPSASRTGSFGNLNSNYKLSGSKFLRVKNIGQESERSASCHGSCEYLNRNTEEDVSISNGLHQESLSSHSYQCPYTINCSTAIKGSEIIQHFQSNHEGPLVQYFQPKLRLSFQQIQQKTDACYVISVEEMMFFLKVLDVSDNDKYKINRDVNSTLPNLLIWVWLLSDSEKCNEHQFRVRILDSEDTTMLSVTSAIYSLAKASWKTIVDHQQGVLINSQMLNAFASFKCEISLDIEIFKVNIAF